jgi:hypothetical protein
MARPIHARMAPPNRSRQRSEQGGPTADHLTLRVHQPFDRRPGGCPASVSPACERGTRSRLPARCRRYFRANVANKKNQKKRDSIFAYSADLSASTGSTLQELSRLPRA